MTYLFKFIVVFFLTKRVWDAHELYYLISLTDRGALLGRLLRAIMINCILFEQCTPLSYCTRTIIIYVIIRAVFRVKQQKARWRIFKV